MIEKQNDEIRTMQPKAVFFDTVADSKDAIEMATSFGTDLVPFLCERTISMRIKPMYFKTKRTPNQWRFFQWNGYSSEFQFGLNADAITSTLD